MLEVGGRGGVSIPGSENSVGQKAAWSTQAHNQVSSGSGVGCAGCVLVGNG